MADVAEFELGLSDPAQATAPDERPAGLTVTVGDSWWHTRICATCGHTFRRGDRVIVDAVARQVQHLEVDLGCASARTSADAEIRTDVREFSAGLLEAWPPPADMPVVRAEQVPELLAPPFSGFRRSRCLFCAHTFRPGELVIVCPCGQGRCVRAVHRDPARGLVCWESWRPDNRVEVCPVLLTRMTR